MLRGTTFRRSLLDPLAQVNLGYDTPALHTFIDVFTKVYAFNAENNPLIKTYKTMFEIARATGNSVFPCIPPEAFQRLITQVITRGPLYGITQNTAVQRAQLGIATDVQPLPVLYSESRLPYIMADLHLRTDGVQPFIVSANGQKIFLTGTTDEPSMEAGLFPFPHGIRALSFRGARLLGKKLSSYLKWCMTCLFNLLTLHKTYPLVSRVE